MLKSLHDMRDLMEDTVTQLPHHVVIQPLIERQLRDHSALGLVVINLEGLDTIEEAHGPQAYQQILKEFSMHLKALKGQVLRNSDYLALSELGGSSFMIFLTARPSASGKGQRSLRRSDVDDVVARIQDSLLLALMQSLGKYAHGLPKMSVGQGFVVYNPLVRKRRLINKLIDEARETARLNKPLLKGRYREMLQRIILNKEITTVFQPIVCAKTQKLLGLEALSRGPKGGFFESPLVLFAVGEQLNLLVELDRLCRQNALSYLNRVPQGCRLFVNTLPKGMHDPLLKRMKPRVEGGESVVFEINEREAIGSFEGFRDVMTRYREKGMSFAIDDVGAGYSSLESIVKLQPQYLKIDRSLITEIQADGVKHDMLRMLVAVAARMGSQVIAEGVETQSDADVLKRIGVPFVQGYYYARPMSLEKLQQAGFSVGRSA